eukprot:1161093-Pelagomonas_calceolata.AAC.10
MWASNADSKPLSTSSSSNRSLLFLPLLLSNTPGPTRVASRLFGLAPAPPCFLPVLLRTSCKELLLLLVKDVERRGKAEGGRRGRSSWVRQPAMVWCWLDGWMAVELLLMLKGVDVEEIDAGAGARWCTPSSRMADASAAGRSCGVECLEQGNGEGIITEPAFEGSLREADET